MFPPKKWSDCRNILTHNIIMFFFSSTEKWKLFSSLWLGTVPCLLDKFNENILIINIFRKTWKPSTWQPVVQTTLTATTAHVSVYPRNGFNLIFRPLNRHFVLVKILIYLNCKRIFFCRVSCPIHNGSFESFVSVKMIKICYLFLLKIDSLQM